MILLDTHALVWFLTEPKHLSSKAHSAIKKALKKEALGVSSISIWEICQLSNKKKIHFSQPLSDTLKIINSMNELHFFPIDNHVAQTSEILPGTFHKDPADRFIVATAILNQATLITKDQKILRYKHVKTLW